MSQQAKQTRSTLLALLVIGVLLLAIFAVLSLRGSLNAPAPTPTPASGVIVVSPPIEPRDFSLPGSSDGQPIRLSDLRGKWTLLFFGYTHCPDFCPLTLAEWVNIKRTLGDDADQLNFLFISVDGERDTPDVMRQYLSRFDPSFVGMTGDPETLAEIGPDYGLDYTLHTKQGANYAVDHTTRVYLLDPESRITYEFSYGTERDATIQTIQAQLASGA